MQILSYSSCVCPSCLFIESTQIIQTLTPIYTEVDLVT